MRFNCLIRETLRLDKSKLRSAGIAWFKRVNFFILVNMKAPPTISLSPSHSPLSLTLSLSVTLVPLPCLSYHAALL